MLISAIENAAASDMDASDSYSASHSIADATSHQSDVLNDASTKPNDYEELNFGFLHDEEETDYIINPEQAIFTNGCRVEVTLLKILTELQAPLWAFEEIMDWANDAFRTGYQFTPRQKTYGQQISHLEQWVGMDHMRPTEVSVKLPGETADDLINVTTFDFMSQFHSLLSDPYLNCHPNLVVNPDSPFTQYTPPDGLLGESLSGSWYRHAWDHMEGNDLGTFMIPIILYIDKTQMSLSGKLSIYPVQMSLSIFTEETRRRASAWRPLGYIANEDYFFSASVRKSMDPDLKNERFHRQLEVILKSFRQAHVLGSLHNIKLQLANASQVVDLYVPLQFIIGDVAGGDELCSRYSYRGPKCMRLCRTCDVTFNDAANTDIQCQRICVADVVATVASQDRQALRQMAQRPFFNSLYHIECGGDPYGVFSMIHTEGLHALEMGLIPYMMDILMAELPRASRELLDELVIDMFQNPRQHGYNQMPRMLWQDGVTNLTHLTGDLKVGKMFAIVCVASTREGEQLFTSAFKGGASTWKKMLYVFQQILCFWMWLKKDTYWMVDDMAACNQASECIRIMMRQLQSLWPRNSGFEWNLTKLHEQFHVPLDIHRNGRHRNVHTGPQEHNHIATKNASKKTQLNRRKLDKQTGERVVDRLIIQCAYDRVRPPDSQPSCVPTGTRNASKAMLLFRSLPDDGPFVADCELVWKSKKHQNVRLLLHDDIMSFLGRHLLQQFGITVQATASESAYKKLHIPFFTEYTKDSVVYRAHPLYRGEHPYYDWAFIRWCYGEDRRTGKTIYKSIIGRILGFFLHPCGSTMAIVHSCDITSKQSHGVFGQLYQLETERVTNPIPKLCMVDVECLEVHACMIPYYRNDSNLWLHISDPVEWHSEFQKIAEEP